MEFNKNSVENLQLTILYLKTCYSTSNLSGMNDNNWFRFFCHCNRYNFDSSHFEPLPFSTASKLSRRKFVQFKYIQGYSDFSRRLKTIKVKKQIQRSLNVPISQETVSLRLNCTAGHVKVLRRTPGGCEKV